MPQQPASLLVVLVDDCKDLIEISHVIERLKNQIALPLNLAGQDIFTSSILIR